MSALSFGFGVLSGIVLTLVTLVIWVRKHAVQDTKRATAWHEEANKLLEERNRISRRQLEIMEAQHASAAVKS